jgi:hypothetical protein
MLFWLGRGVGLLAFVSQLVERRDSRKGAKARRGVRAKKREEWAKRTKQQRLKNIGNQYIQPRLVRNREGRGCIGYVARE